MKHIGLTGLRGVGKSTAALMIARRGYILAHAFGPGKAAAKAYFEHAGAPEDIASRMVYGNLKDKPSVLLPGMATPRVFLEKFGKWMADLGAEWTLGIELDRVELVHPGAAAIVESVVYEAPLLMRRGGVIVRVLRPGYTGPAGIETDAAQAEIAADFTLVNDGTLEDLSANVDTLLTQICRVSRSSG